MMQTLFYRWIGLGLLTGVFCGCSEKVETEEKEVVVEEEVEGIKDMKKLDTVEPIVAEKLHRTIIPKLDFQDRTLEEALDYLRLRFVELDQTESDPARRGMNMVIRQPRVKSDSKTINESSEDLLGGGEVTSTMIPDLRVRNVSYAAAFRYICLMTDMRCEVDPCLGFSPRDPNAAWNTFGSVLEDKGDTSHISKKLSQIRVPRVDFEDTSIHEAIDYLRFKSAEFDVTELEPSKKGINFVLYVPEEMTPSYIDKLQMADASVEEVLKEICSKTGMRYELDPYSVILVPKDLK